MEEADELFLRAIGIQEKSLGPDHWKLADSLSNRAGVLQTQVMDLPFWRCLHVDAGSGRVALLDGFIYWSVWWWRYRGPVTWSLMEPYRSCGAPHAAVMNASVQSVEYLELRWS